MIASAQRRFAARLRTVRRLRLRPGIAALWGALPAARRVALGGILASAAVAVALGMFIPFEMRRHLLVAEGIVTPLQETGWT